MGKSLSIFVAGVLVGALAATACFSYLLKERSASKDSGTLLGSQARVLQLAHSLDPNHPVHQSMEHMAKRLDEISGGRLRLEIYPSGVLGSETECLEQLQNGVLDMTKTSSAPIEGFIEEMQVFGLPYLFEDDAHYWGILNGPIGKELLHKGRGKNLYGLCYYDAGSRSFYTQDRPILKPADLAGMKIRVQNSPVAMRLVEVLGGAPTPIAWGELYTALAQGTVDGAENNPPSFVSNKHYETCKYLSLDEHTRVPDILLISTQVWDGLTSQEQQWLQRAADESSRFQRELWTRRVEEVLEEAREYGVQISEPDKGPFVEKVKPMFEAYQDTAVGELVRRIRDEL